MGIIEKFELWLLVLIFISILKESTIFKIAFYGLR